MPLSLVINCASLQTAVQPPHAEQAPATTLAPQRTLLQTGVQRRSTGSSTGTTEVNTVASWQTAVQRTLIKHMQSKLQQRRLHSMSTKLLICAGPSALPLELELQPEGKDPPISQSIGISFPRQRGGSGGALGRRTRGCFCAGYPAWLWRL